MQSSKRSRCELSDDDLVRKIVPCVTHASFLPNTQRLTGTYVQKHAAELVSGLHELQPNLSFRKNDMCRVFKKVFAAKHVEVGLEHKLEEEWSTQMAHRTRGCCRFTAQALCKRPRPQWLRALFPDMHVVDLTDAGAGAEGQQKHVKDSGGEEFDEAAAEPQDDAATGDQAASNSNTQYTYGWDPETRQACCDTRANVFLMNRSRGDGFVLISVKNNL